MYSIITIDKIPVVIPSEYVQPTNKVLAFGITDKTRAYEILTKIKNKQKQESKNSE